MNTVSNLFNICRLDCCGCCSSECQNDQQPASTTIARKQPPLELEKRMNLMCIQRKKQAAHELTEEQQL